MVASYAANWQRLSGTLKGRMTTAMQLYFLMLPKVALNVLRVLFVDSSGSIGASGSRVVVTSRVLR